MAINHKLKHHHYLVLEVWSVKFISNIVNLDLRAGPVNLKHREM